MKNAIIAELKNLDLQPIPATVTKVIQLYETKNSRHSTMIVGSTMTGKSVCWKVLQATLTRLNKEGTDPNAQVVKVRTPPLTCLCRVGYLPSIKCVSEIDFILIKGIKGIISCPEFTSNINVHVCNPAIIGVLTCLVILVFKNDEPKFNRVQVCYNQ